MTLWTIMGAVFQLSKFAFLQVLSFSNFSFSFQQQLNHLFLSSFFSLQLSILSAKCFAPVASFLFSLSLCTLPIIIFDFGKNRLLHCFGFTLSFFHAPASHTTLTHKNISIPNYT